MKIETTPIPATAVHSLVLYDCDRDALWSFADAPGYEPIVTGLEIAKLADTIIVHSDFALKTLFSIYGVEFDDVIDTFKLAEAINGKGGNSLAVWAKRLNIALRCRCYRRRSTDRPQCCQLRCPADAPLAGRTSSTARLGAMFTALTDSGRVLHQGRGAGHHRSAGGPQHRHAQRH